MEYGIYQVLATTLINDACPSNAALTFMLTDEPGFENCTVALTCDAIALNDGSDEFQYYLTSTGTCDGGKIVTQHKVEAEVKI